MGVRIGLLKAIDRLARLRAEKIDRVDQPVADLAKRETKEAPCPERRQHRLRALLRAVRLSDGVDAAEPAVEARAGAIGGDFVDGMFDAQFLAEIEHDRRQPRWRLAPARKTGVALGISVELRDEWREARRRRQELHPPGALRRAMLGDARSRGSIVQDRPPWRSAASRRRSCAAPR
jgi:hypothetical protein